MGLSQKDVTLSKAKGLRAGNEMLPLGPVPGLGSVRPSVSPGTAGARTSFSMTVSDFLDKPLNVRYLLLIR